MRSTLSNFVTTVLTFGSLLAIPVVAIFGLPDFAKISEWADKENDGAFSPIKNAQGELQAQDSQGAEQFGDAPVWDGGASREATQAEPVAGYAPAPQRRIPGSQSRRPRNFRDGVSSPRRVTPVGWQLERSRSEVSHSHAAVSEAPPSPASRTEAFEIAADLPDREPRNGQGMASQDDRLIADVTPVRPSASSPEPANAAPLTWRAAIARLNALGIRQYRLQPGSQPSVFHFSCYFTPEDNPRIYHRFESEAGDPLQAVADVLAQVERWRSRS